MAYLVKVPNIESTVQTQLQNLANVTKKEKLSLIKPCKKSINNPGKNPQKVVIDKPLPFQKNLDLQFELWKNFISDPQNPISQIAQQISQAYLEANSQKGFKLKLNDSLLLKFKPNQILVSSNDGKNFTQINNKLKLTAEECQQNLNTYTALRELRAVDYWNHLGDESTYKSLVTQSKSSSHNPPSWDEIVENIFQVHKSINKKGLPQAISWIAQVVSAIPHNADFVSPEMSLLKLIGVVDKSGKPHLPSSKRLKYLKLPSIFIGLPHTGPVRGRAPNYPVNWHTMNAKINNSAYSHMPTGLTAIQFKGEQGTASSQGSNPLPKQFGFEINTFSPEEFLPSSIPEDPAEIKRALLRLASESRNESDKNIINAIINKLFIREKKKPLLTKIDEAFTILSGENESEKDKSKDKKKYLHLLEPIRRVIYLGEKAFINEPQIPPNVTHLTKLAEQMLADLEYPFSPETPLDNNPNHKVLIHATKLAGQALKLDPSDLEAQLCMAKALIKNNGRDTGNAQVLLQQVIDGANLTDHELSQLYLLKAFSLIQQSQLGGRVERNPLVSLFSLHSANPDELAKQVKETLDKALSKEPDLIDNLKREATSLSQQNSLSRAQKDHLKALRLLLIGLEPSNINAYLNLKQDLNLIFPQNADITRRFTLHCNKSVKLLLESLEKQTGREEQLKESIYNLVSHCLKYEHYTSLYNLFQGKGEKYLELYNKSEKTRILLSIASIKDNEQEKSILIQKVQELEPNVYERLSKEIENIEEENYTKDTLRFQLSLLEEDPQKRQKIDMERYDFLCFESREKTVQLIQKMIAEFDLDSVLPKLLESLKSAQYKGSEYKGSQSSFVHRVTSIYTALSKFRLYGKEHVSKEALLSFHQELANYLQKYLVEKPNSFNALNKPYDLMIKYFHGITNQGSEKNKEYQQITRELQVSFAQYRIQEANKENNDIKLKMEGNKYVESLKQRRMSNLGRLISDGNKVQKMYQKAAQEDPSLEEACKKGIKICREQMVKLEKELDSLQNS